MPRWRGAAWIERVSVAVAAAADARTCYKVCLVSREPLRTRVPVGYWLAGGLDPDVCRARGSAARADPTVWVWVAARAALRFMPHWWEEAVRERAC